MAHHLKATPILIRVTSNAVDENMGLNLWMQNIASRIMLVVMLVLVLPCKQHSINCTVYDDPFPIPHKSYQPGEFVIGVIVSQVAFHYNYPTFMEQPALMMMMEESISVPKKYQHILALAFAVKEVNENPNILSNLSLGFYILNSYYTARMTYKATLNLLSSQHRFVPNFNCHQQNNVITLIGGCISEISVNVAVISASYKIPQITYGSFLQAQDFKNHFPYVFHMVPNEILQYRGIVQLLLHFRWTWIGLAAVDDDKGERFLQTMVPMLSENGICDAFIIRLPKWAFVDEFVDLFLEQWKSYQILLETKANVLLVYGEDPSFQDLRIMLFAAPFFALPPLGKVWIITSHWDFATLSFEQIWDIQTFYGSISSSVHSNQPLGFQEFVQMIRPSQCKEDGFILDFWEQAFICSLRMPNGQEEEKSCTGKEKLETLPGTLFEMNMTGHSYNIYNAVYAVAHSLHATLESISKHGRLIKGKKLVPQDVYPWLIHHFLGFVSFNNSAGETVHFNANRELIASFDVTNWLMFPNGSLFRVKVGRLEPHAPPGKELTINDDEIVWHESFHQVLPRSVCNDNCYPGYSKKKKEGEHFCCYDCDPCPEGMISYQKGMEQNV
ncbi:hypothetical protein JD844_001686 [Phrynosoma platyrhinos]|uniref:Vomeronasal type-2 receptor 26-like n=1 Tax=Phrynosoma platyrhinos TaxID=52577 RepID=A0ABQ7TAT8_PHRPL|nr:hypothetical protein JD844_001686 [Phrynosoma platyrhinos]